jgi:hypothetical protein
VRFVNFYGIYLRKCRYLPRHINFFKSPYHSLVLVAAFTNPVDHYLHILSTVTFRHFQLWGYDVVQTNRAVAGGAYKMHMIVMVMTFRTVFTQRIQHAVVGRGNGMDDAFLYKGLQRAVYRYPVEFFTSLALNIAMCQRVGRARKSERIFLRLSLCSGYCGAIHRPRRSHGSLSIPCCKVTFLPRFLHRLQAPAVPKASGIVNFNNVALFCLPAPQTACAENPTFISVTLFAGSSILYTCRAMLYRLSLRPVRNTHTFCIYVHGVSILVSGGQLNPFPDRGV